MDIGTDLLMIKYQIIFDLVILLFIVGLLIKMHRWWERIRLMETKGMEAVERLCVIDRKTRAFLDRTFHKKVLSKKETEERKWLKEEKIKAEAFYKETHPGFNFSL